MPNAIPSLDTIVGGAVEIADPAERAAYLDRACGPDDALRRRASALVAAHGRAGGFLERPAPAVDPTAAFVPGPEDAPGPAAGTEIGPYTLRELIGEGGMGLVYVAEQREPVRRRVALKVIKPGMDTRQVVGRFETERQALALMDHPNIAKVLDGGSTADGRPFFVMELVKGVPVTEYCDAHRLTIRHRLGVFLQVCRAVQHAHQKGVIHRDLKPSNVLVTVHDVEPVAKVIDFGIAKAVGQLLTDKTVYTGFAQLVGTPLYMSPEQAGQSGLDVDTRTDVYALGVLLYELLTGTTPIDPASVRGAGYDELRRIIREDESARPSARISTLNAAALSTVADKRGIDPRKLAAQVRGELDWVVMKCLEKDRNRRYDSASALAADVQRYLVDEPVAACPPSAAYRLRKFARRNRGRVAVVGSILGLIVLVAVAGIAAGVTRLWLRAESSAAEAAEARDRAEGSRDRVEAALGRAEVARAGEEEARRHATQLSYLHRLNLAHQSWLQGDLLRADLLLEGCPADLRDWEWRYVRRLLHPEVFATRISVTGQQGLTPLAFSPDGRLAYTFAPLNADPKQAGDPEVRLLDVATGRETSFPGHPHTTSLAFSPDGTLLAVGSESRAPGNAPIQVPVVILVPRCTFTRWLFHRCG